jgi:hypothetical protein
MFLLGKTPVVNSAWIQKYKSHCLKIKRISRKTTNEKIHILCKAILTEL